MNQKEFNKVCKVNPKWEIPTILRNEAEKSEAQQGEADELEDRERRWGRD